LIETKLILWTGPKHSGKTTSAAKLAEHARGEGFRIAGLLAPSVYVNGSLTGFEVWDLSTGCRTLLTKRHPGTGKSRRFTFTRSGRRLGKDALTVNKTKPADLVIVDEFGPLELAGRAWKKCVDSLMTATNALKVLVVRDELVKKVQNVYPNISCERLPADDPQSITTVLKILRSLRKRTP
jgi:nucleoside-triphosphatase THEP1